MVGKPVNPKCGLLVECVGNRHDDNYLNYCISLYFDFLMQEEEKVKLLEMGSDENEERVSSVEKIGSAVFYGVSSFAVIFVNKWVLSMYGFPSFMFVATTQFLATSIILSALSLLKKVEIPTLTKGIFLEVAPVSLMFLGNVITGLGSTQALNLPMFTALRRFSILMTMLGEYFLLGREASSPIVVSVIMMVGGALIAAMYDLTFDLWGYILVLLNDLFTAMNGIYMKKATLSGQCTKMGILYYNSLFSCIAMCALFSIQCIQELGFQHLRGSEKLGANSAHVKQEYSPFSLGPVFSFQHWGRIDFIVLFIMAALLGSILNYSIFLCTTHNSALTTTVIGCLKNVLTTYIGMLFMTDYEFTWLNFIGLNVSITGSLYYTYVTMIKGTPGFGGA